jgi:hypothetical protein
MKPVPLREINPSFNPELEKIIFKALEKDRGNRFATAAEMQRAIDHLASSIGQPTTDEDVGAFVQQTMGDVIKERAKNLRAAITTVDGPLSSSRSSSPQIDPKLIPTFTGPAAGAPASSAPPPAKDTALAATPIYEDITIDDDISDDEKPAPAVAPTSRPVPVTPMPTSDINAPKVIVSPAIAASTKSRDASAGAPDSAKGNMAAQAVPAMQGMQGSVGLLDWPSTPQKLPDSVRPPPMMDVGKGAVLKATTPPQSDAGLSGAALGGASSEVPLVKDDDFAALAPKRRKLVPVALGGLLLVGLIVGGLSLSGGDKPKTTASPEERTGTAPAVTPSVLPTGAAVKPAETAVVAAPTPTEAPVATADPAPTPPATADTAEATAAPTPTPEPAQPTPPSQPIVAAPKATPPPVRPTTKPTIKPTTKPTTKPSTPPKKYNPSGI